MFTTDSDFEAWPHSAAILDGNADETSNAARIENLERIVVKDLTIDIGRQESPGIVATEAKRRLSEIIRTEREKFRFCCNLVGRKSSTGKLYHGADQILQRLSRSSENILRSIFENGPLIFKFPDRGNQWNHDLGANVDASFVSSDSGLEDSASLHFCNLGERYPKPAAAMAKHRVRLTK